MFLSEINEIYSFVIDNDNWQKKNQHRTDEGKLNFEEFDKWILGKSE